MINCLLIDDEPLALQILEDFVHKTPFLNLVGKFEEPLLALPLLESQKIELLFLDIKCQIFRESISINHFPLNPKSYSQRHTANLPLIVMS